MNLLEEELADRTNRKKNLVKKWNEYNFIDKCGITDPWEQLDFAVLLENQIYHEDQNPSDFRRMGIPLLVRVWKQLITNEIASIQPLLSKTDYFYIFNNKEIEITKWVVSAKTFKRKVPWSAEAMQDLKSAYKIDAEMEFAEITSEEIAGEIDRRTIGMMLHHGNIHYNESSSIDESIDIVSSKIANNLGGAASWLVTSPEIASILGLYDDNPFTSSLIRYIGTIKNKYKVYVDPLFVTNRVLIGYKGNHPYDSAYFYCPHTMIMKSPTVLDPNSFIPRVNLLSHEEHIMLHGGNKFYSTLMINGLASLGNQAVV